jgi:hypothetical protein
MEEKELEKEIYKILGIKEGSLKSNSGNDWERAKNQILEEEKRKLFERNDFDTKQNYLTMEKNNELYIIALKSSSVFEQFNKTQIAKRDDLEEKEIDELIKYGDKDVLINITKFQKLNENQIDKSIEKHTYNAIKNIIENQNVNEKQLSLMTEIMIDSRIYKDLMKKVNEKYNIGFDVIVEEKQVPIFQSNYKTEEVKEENISNETEKTETNANEVSIDSLLKLNDKNKELLKESVIAKEDSKLSNLNSNNNNNEKENTKKEEVRNSTYKQR